MWAKVAAVGNAADTGNGRGILGVVDGVKSKGIETESDVEARRQMLRKFGYKL